MEDRDQVIIRLKAMLFDANNENQSLRAFAAEVAHLLGLEDATFEDIREKLKSL